MNNALFSLFICFCLLSPTAFSEQTIDNLINQDKLTISLTVNESEQQIVGQALVVSIEVATNRWFATGTRVQSFTLTDVVMQTNNITTINGSKRVKGQSWATQTHEITLYPTLAGSYLLPEIKVDVSVNTENDGIISGVLMTQEAGFTINLPEALIGIDNFIVSPEVSLSIDGQFDSDNPYSIGEAITQTITITASNTPAMMIPEVNLTNISKANEKITEGISIYHKPAKVFDKSNRGTLSGSRVESFTYIFEKPGDYVLAEQILYWWNSQTNTLETLQIPASSWRVSDKGFINQHSFTNGLRGLDFTLTTLLIIALFFVALALLYVIFIKRKQLVTLYKKISQQEQRQLRQQFLSNIARKEYLLATQTLYQYSMTLDKPTETKSYQLTKRLHKLAFQNDQNKDSSLTFSIEDAQLLIKQVADNTASNVKESNFPFKSAIHLNKK
ncbi:BatD family protein [Colwellia psychrerythraea]|uniref:Aerotolerance-related protein BatD n=1 Tax=Colwellia psychrerythraea TaxID=28229 RepID=A0A099KJA8_COLPS|nr:BatD family protein [Colwellia psychrerythraea]KGJ89643.1 Aerotolerance-related protein BatD [Colwellia psychrerythraea]